MGWEISKTWKMASGYLLMLGLHLVASAYALVSVEARGNDTTYSGRATAVQATVLGTTKAVSDTGPLPESGGALDAHLLQAQIDGLLTAEALHAATNGQGDQSRAEASVAYLDLTVGGNRISADFLMARATASCEPGGPVIAGRSEVVGLAINGETIAVATEPNQTISLPGGKVVINEEIAAVSGRTGSITVNALHVLVDGLADVIISSAHADITCRQPVCPGGDFITGGGWVTGTPSGAKGTFGVAGGIKNSALWGHLNYIDHGSRLKVKGTGVTTYNVVDDTTRRIEGTAQINGQDGFTYQLEVADFGEPGRGDLFTITLSNGYSASGALAGGNMQLHQPCR